jgi:hypothetical protein
MGSDDRQKGREVKGLGEAEQAQEILRSKKFKYILSAWL